MNHNIPNKKRAEYDGQSSTYAGLTNKEHEEDSEDSAMDGTDVGVGSTGSNIQRSIMNRFKNDEESMDDDINEDFIAMKTNESTDVEEATHHFGNGDDDDDDDVELVEKPPPPLPPPPPQEPLEQELPVADVVSNPELLSLLINELRTIAMSSGNYLSVMNMNDAIHYEKAQNILEATAGDVFTAAQLYWDDYLATLQEQQHGAQEQQQQNEEQHDMNLNDSNDDYHGGDDDDDDAHAKHQQEMMWSLLPPEPAVGSDHTSNTNTTRRRHRRGSNQDATYLSDMNPYRVQQQNPLPLSVAGEPQAATSNENLSFIQRLEREKNKDKNVSWEFDNYNFRRQDRNRRKYQLQHRKMAKAKDQAPVDPLLLLRNQNEIDSDNSAIGNRNLHLQQLLLDFHHRQRQVENDNNIVDHNFRSGELEPPADDNYVESLHQSNRDDILRLFSQGQKEDVDLLDDDNDDDDFDEIIVRRNSPNSSYSKQRLLKFLRDSKPDKINKDAMSNPVSVKRRRLANKIEKANGANESIDGHDDDDNEDDYFSDNDWIWESLANMSALTEVSPITLPMDLLWGGSRSVTEAVTETTTTAKEAEVCGRNNIESPNIITTKVSDNNGHTKSVVKVRAQDFLEKFAKTSSRQKQDVSKKPLPSAHDFELPSSLPASIVNENVDKGKHMDDVNHENSDDEGNAVKSDDAVAGIPRTWMSAGFHLVKSTMAGASDDVDVSTTIGDKTSLGCNAPNIVGLAVQPPNDNDFTYNMWKKQQTDNDARHATIPLPYHCRSITALLSIVTGLMYTGATVDSGGHVSCTSSRQPLQELVLETNMKSKTNPKVKLSKGELMYRELSESDRLGREYESRLVDALTALLRIAAEASMKRKARALQVLQTSKDPTDQRRWLLIKRKLRLVPTCWWEVPPNEIRLMHTEMPKDDLCCLPIIVSYTNIEDLRSYVQGNIRAFTTSGGCALFLETIARIHGKGALSHMIRRSRKAAGYTGSDVSISLLCCKCTRCHMKSLDDNPVLAKTLKAKSKKGMPLDTTPPGHSCLSTELLSLLLVGRVHSTLQGWSASPLGLGILSNTMNVVGRGLTRPEKPVWILRGPTCYSVMWLNGCSDHSTTFSRIDHPGTVASITHWNCWYGIRNATQIRLVTDRSKSFTSSPSSFECNDVEGNNKMNFALQMSLRRYANERWVRACNEVELVDPALVVSSKDMQSVTVHPDDPSFYPNLYRMWRYDISNEPITSVDDNDTGSGTNHSADRKPHVPTWKSYHSLNHHEKHVIETKLGPQICTVLWTRWPRATVDRFIPNDCSPIV